ncbi:unnamed protein product [Diplocarpon coronariae]
MVDGPRDFLRGLMLASVRRVVRGHTVSSLRKLWMLYQDFSIFKDLDSKSFDSIRREKGVQSNMIVNLGA